MKCYSWQSIFKNEIQLFKYSLEALSSSSISSWGGCSGNITPTSESAGGSSNIPSSVLLRSLSTKITNQEVKVRSINLISKCKTILATTALKNRTFSTDYLQPWSSWCSLSLFVDITQLDNIRARECGVCHTLYLFHYFHYCTGSQWLTLIYICFA